MSLPEDPEATVLRAEYPAWEIWPGIDGLWRARKPGHSGPDGRPVMAWGQDLAGLRDDIRRYEGLYGEDV